jgi:hypothetical protein
MEVSNGAERDGGVCPSTEDMGEGLENRGPERGDTDMFKRIVAAWSTEKGSAARGEE